MSSLAIKGISEQINETGSYLFDYSELDFDQCTAQDGRDRFIRDAVILGIFLFVGFLGNCCLMGVILSNPRLRTSANILLTNLALGDLVYVLVSAPFFLEHEIHHCWQYGPAACKLVNFTQVMVQGVCVYTLTALSIERYSVLVKGGTLRHGGRMMRGLLAAGCVWVIAVVVASPILAFAHMEHGTACKYTEVSSTAAKAYEVSRVILMYMLPLITITCLYTIIAQTLLQSAGAFAGETQPGARHFSARRRLALTVLILAFFFGLFWLPYYIYIVWFQLDNPSLVELAHIDVFRNFYYFSAMANSCLNPFVIFAMSTSHRRALLKCFPCPDHTQVPMTSVAHTRSMANGIPGEKAKQAADSKSGSRNTRCTEL